jgi:PleD family two-component response regulator
LFYFLTGPALVSGCTPIWSEMDLSGEAVEKILIVDDEAFIRENLERILSEDG